jgi:hypothetical protein
MNTAQKGRRNEHKAREWLESLGYVVTRSAASKGAWDIVGINDRGVALGQVKSNQWPGPAERLSLELFRAPEGTRRLMFRFDDRLPMLVRELVAGEWVDID